MDTIVNMTGHIPPPSDNIETERGISFFLPDQDEDKLLLLGLVGLGGLACSGTWAASVRAAARPRRNQPRGGGSVAAGTSACCAGALCGSELSAAQIGNLLTSVDRHCT